LMAHMRHQSKTIAQVKCSTQVEVVAVFAVCGNKDVGE
jgi:hypothetical protein